MHLQSVVFHVDYLASDRLDEFLSFMKDSRIITYNFYCFATENSIEDVFNYTSPNTVSFQHSLLVSPSLVDYHSFGTDGLHFLSLVNYYFDENRYLHIPLVLVEDSMNEKTALTLCGYASITNSLNLFLLNDYYALNFLYEQDFIFYSNDEKTFELRNFRFYSDIINNAFVFIIRATPLEISEQEKNALKIHIEKTFRRYFDDYIQKEGELYFIKMYNYLNKKALNAQSYQIIVLI